MLIIYFLILLSVLSLVLMPYKRVALGRIFAVRKIKKLCRERDINFKIINRAYPITRNKKSEFDFIFRIDKTVVPVKFFSATDKNSTVLLDRSGKTCTARQYKKSLSRDGSIPLKTVKKYGRLPNMRINRKIVGERNTCFPVFLNEPKFSRVLFRNERGEISDFYDGNHRVAGCSFMDKDLLLDLISVYDDK